MKVEDQEVYCMGHRTEQFMAPASEPHGITRGSQHIPDFDQSSVLHDRDAFTGAGLASMGESECTCKVRGNEIAI
jgi:hypothetical protein